MKLTIPTWLTLLRILMILRDRWIWWDVASVTVLYLILFKGVRDERIEYSRNLALSALFLLAVVVAYEVVRRIEQRMEQRQVAAELDARLRYSSIGEVLDEGLHAWLTDFILLVRQLGNTIHTSYLEVA